MRRAISSGHLTTLPDGSLAEELVGGPWRRGNRAADTGADKVRTVRTATADEPSVLEQLEAQPHGGALKRTRRVESGDELDGDTDDLIRRMLSGEVLSLVDAERMKANGLALRQFVNARLAAGALVEIELAERVMFEEARKGRDAWLGFASRVGPLMAADLDVAPDKVVEALTAHVHDQLADLGEPELDFTG